MPHINFLNVAAGEVIKSLFLSIDIPAFKDVFVVELSFTDTTSKTHISMIRNWKDLHQKRNISLFLVVTGNANTMIINTL